jgi:branched-chain amino acid transport system permease protein
MHPPLLPRHGIVSWSEMCFLALCLILAATIRNPHYADIMVLTFLWSGLALSWNIAGGYAGLISFGHAAFFGISAYISSLLLVNLGISPWIGIWIGAAFAGMFGGLLALICARLRGPFFILSTLAVGEVTRIAALNWRSLTRGAEGLEIPPVANFTNMVFASKPPYVVLVLIYFIAIFLISKYLEQSRFGYYMFAIRGDEEAASSIGVNPLWMRVSAMALSASLSGIGGSLFAQYFLYLDPTHVISPDLSFQFALICVIGGIGTAIGPVIGGFIVTPLSELLRSWLSGASSGLHLAIYGLVLIIVVLYFPSGVAGAISKLSKSRNLPPASKAYIEN